MDNARILDHLERVLTSGSFSRAGRQSRLLRYVVENTLAGRTEQLKEYAIALDVFDREDGYDPKLDSAVRVEMSKLRARLDRYYEAAGTGDGIRIEVPKGSYIARFAEAASPEEAPLPLVEPAPILPANKGLTRRQLAAGLALGGVSAAAGAALLLRNSAPAAPVLLVHGETADRGGYTGEAAQLLQALANELGFLRVPIIEAKDMRELAARSEGAAYCVTVMAGRCWEDGRRLRLVAEMREASCDNRVWSSVWDRESGQRGALARIAAAAIGGQVNSIQRRARPSAGRRKALAPYREAQTAIRPRKDFVLQSTGDKLKRTSLEDLMRTARLLEEAARLDPSFAEAVGQLAWIYRLAAAYDSKMTEQAARTARRALTLDAMSVEGNYVTGYLDLLELWNIAAAETSLRRCIDRSAFHIEAYRLYGDAAAIRGHAGEAMAVLARPLSVLPRDRVLQFAAVTTLLQAGRAGEAEQVAREALRWEPGWPLGRWLLGRTLEGQHRTREAEQEFRSIQKADPKSQRFAAALAHVLAETGGSAAYAEAMALLRDLGMDRQAPSLVGLVEAQCGSPERALPWMERAEREHDHNLPYSVIDPHFRPLLSFDAGQRIRRKFVA